MKLYLIWKTLELRAQHPEAFAGSYEPLEAGPGVCAFSRGGDVIVAVALEPEASFSAPAGYRDVFVGADLGAFLFAKPERAVKAA